MESALEQGKRPRSLWFWCLGGTLLVLVVLRLGMVVINGRSALNTVPVSGKITQQGSPLPWGTVMFNPVDRKVGRPGTADIRADGSYEVDTLASTKGLVAGQYKVSVQAAKAPQYEPSSQQQAAAARIKLPTPARYANPETSGLTLTVQSGDSPKTYNIDLKD